MPTIDEFFQDNPDTCLPAVSTDTAIPMDSSQ